MNVALNAGGEETITFDHCIIAAGTADQAAARAPR